MFFCIEMSALEAANALRSRWLDWILYQFLAIDLLRMGVPALLVAYVWLRPHGTIRGNEEFVLRSFAGIVLSLVANTAVRQTVPQRPRPRLALPDFPFPDARELGHLEDIKSFPSDTSVLAAALAMVVLMRSWRLGAVALLWTIAIVAFPRLYIGYHYLSDLLAGLALGASVAWVAIRLPLPAVSAAGARLSRLHARSPAVVMVFVCWAIYEFIGLFPTLQRAIPAAGEVVKGLR